ncbi:MAG: hypothetical protein IBJ09_10710 [Bacteroidia bacterium]|nr:hypothetical protein [Bacteroidia bacterium]
MIWFILEIAVALLFAAGLITGSLHTENNEQLLALSMVLTLIVYGLLGTFTLRDRVNKQNKILLSAVCGFAFGLAGVSIWFKLVQVPGSFFISLGTMFLLTLAFGFAYMSEQKQEAALKRYHRLLMLRLMVFSALVLLSIWIPDSSVINWKYSDRPELRDVKLQLREHPRDTTLLRLEKQLEQAGK